MSQAFEPMQDTEQTPRPLRSDAPPAPATPVPRRSADRKGRGIRKAVIILLLATLAAGAFVLIRSRMASSGAAKGGDAPGSFPVPVIAGAVAQKDVPLYLDGLGTVQALNTVTVHPRVDGELKKVAFVEGQDVKAGDLLVQIDDAPFRAQFQQTQAKKGQDQALLDNARRDLDRYLDLIEKKAISPQQYETQKALVAQLEAAVNADQAAIESAKVQLDYTTVLSPIAGHTGIRLVDQGNVVHAGDQRGLVVITQLQPVSLVFTLPAQNLGEIHKQMVGGSELTILAVDRDNRTILDTGKLTVIDNQIDTTTGTIVLKATFPNRDLQLWPGQFINARLLLEVRKDGLVVPASVVQRGPNGPYAFVIKADLSVEMRPVKVAQIEQGEALIDDGLQIGERVVVDGQYKLQPGSRVKLSDGPSKDGPPAGARGPRTTKK